MSFRSTEPTTCFQQTAWSETSRHSYSGQPELLHWCCLRNIRCFPSTDERFILLLFIYTQIMTDIEWNVNNFIHNRITHRMNQAQKSRYVFREWTSFFCISTSLQVLLIHSLFHSFHISNHLLYVTRRGLTPFATRNSSSFPIFCFKLKTLLFTFSSLGFSHSLDCLLGFYFYTLCPI